MFKITLTFPDEMTEHQVTEIQPTYERPLPIVPSDAGPDYTLMTRPGSDKVRNQTTGQTHKKLVREGSDYVEPLSTSTSGYNQRLGLQESGTCKTILMTKILVYEIFQ